MANIVAIVGRPNVGKSTLFNRLVEARDAIIDNQSGVTRDRHYGESVWNGKRFSVIDTGGYVVGSDDVFEGAIRQQVEVAMEEASALLFVVDTEIGLTPLDEDFANVVRRSKKPVFLVVNKADNIERMHGAPEFYALNLGTVYPISAMSGSGTGELLDDLAAVLHETPDEEERDETPRIAVVGRPNAGKSSLVNLLLNKERSIVTDIAGTTRDAVDAHYKAFGKDFILTDTAGIRKRARIKEDLEFYSILRSIKAIERSDVCIVMIDATRGLESQDMNIIRMAQSNKKGLMIMINKWDLVEKDHTTAKEYEDEIKEKLAPNDHIPIFFTSVLTKQRILKAMEKAIEICEERRRKIPTSKLNEVMQKAIEKQPPAMKRGHNIGIKYVTQLPTYTPTFAFFCNFPKLVDESYKRYLENQLRKNFGFDGVPLQLVFKQK
jgi:GTP-binding protein